MDEDTIRLTDDEVAKLRRMLSDPGLADRVIAIMALSSRKMLGRVVFAADGTFRVRLDLEQSGVDDTLSL